MKIVKNIALVMLGIFGIGIAMALMTKGNVGTDPITLLINGVARKFNISSGWAANILNVFYLAILLIFYRKVIRISTLLSVLFMGSFMDFGLWVLNGVMPNEPNFWVGLVLNIVGVVLLGASIGIYLSVGYGSSPADGMVLWIQSLIKLRYQYCSWIFYAICCIVGILLGEMIGVGTVIALVLVGVVCDRTLQCMKKITEKNDRPAEG